ncbi:hypothetical protein [Emticicia sp. BO119]|uniref:hypothetical protein n=1 Tax=Emticicia sp. BO119 TaxID=2757768 RepID=UPI0015F0E0ED|nr:hypothetical protein [Emticicia sp. BO119]MBA4850509.1 hypothetical protein [Emticicia sp. BO119]
MKKIVLSLLTSFILNTGFCQKVMDISASISPAFPIGALSDYVGGGFGLLGDFQTELKKNLAVGGELAFHKLSEEGYSQNTFFTVSAYALKYFTINYSLGRAPLRPYIGLGLGLYRSQYSDYFFGDDPSQSGIVFSPRFGLRMDVDRLFLTGEGRLHLSTGYADSYVPILITFGYRLYGK